jgi:ribonuclease HI
MSAPQPHFLLFSLSEQENKQGQWKFVLQAADGSATLEAEDSEPEIHGERLELLAVIRGLEALDQPSHVTLMTSSRYVNRGLTYGLEEWRRNDWTWESFGEMVPVKNQDLWQRLDHALRFHKLEVRPLRFDGPHALRGPYSGVGSSAAPAGSRPSAVRRPHFRLPATSAAESTAPVAMVKSRAAKRPSLVARLRQRVRAGLERSKFSLFSLRNSWLPRPRLG